MFCVETPPSGVGSGLLQWPNGKTLPHEGGATVFADCRYAYRSLSPAAKAAADAFKVQYLLREHLRHPNPSIVAIGWS